MRLGLGNVAGVSVESGLVQAVLETLLAKSLGLGNVYWATSLAVAGLMAAIAAEGGGTVNHATALERLLSVLSVESGLVQAVLEALLAKSLRLGNVHWATSLVVGLMAAMCLGLGNAPGVTCLVVVGLEATLADVNDLVGSLEELLPLGGRC